MNRGGCDDDWALTSKLSGTRFPRLNGFRGKEVEVRAAISSDCRRRDLWGDTTVVVGDNDAADLSQNNRQTSLGL